MTQGHHNRKNPYRESNRLLVSIYLLLGTVAILLPFLPGKAAQFWTDPAGFITGAGQPAPEEEELTPRELADRMLAEAAAQEAADGAGDTSDVQGTEPAGTSALTPGDAEGQAAAGDPATEGAGELSPEQAADPAQAGTGEDTLRTPDDPIAPEPDPEPLSMANTLFIGDSRTVGLFEYGGLTETDFFCETGLSIHNIYKKELSVAGSEKMTLEQLLELHDEEPYSKIYIMIGINELGTNNLEGNIEAYEALVKDLTERQFGAEIFVQANLHVTKARSDRDRNINNEKIDLYNEMIEEMAIGYDLHYLDVNPVFDDGEGNLSTTYTGGDDAHLRAKYYEQWVQWIIEQTAEILNVPLPESDDHPED
ncbi:MAG: hypothetical protein IKS07_09185 [Lachnospiraceae bacterium]|nr:hypothetical protein [Lachnospiraceae bacterium]